MATFNGSTSKVAIDFRKSAFWGLNSTVDVQATSMHTATRYQERLDNGFVGDAFGTSLKYVLEDGKFYLPVSGTVTRLTLTDTAGAKVFDFSGFSITIQAILAVDNWTSTLKTVLAGNDTIKGGAGNDFLYGFGGNDVLEGGGGEDHLYGGDGADVLRGGIGNDETFDDLEGGAGNDTLDGTGGFSIAVYANATGAINGNFATGKVTGDASVGTDTLVNIKEIYGSMFADTLLGSAGDNYFTGSGGNDFISGGAGTDGVIYDTRVSANLATGKASDGLGGTDTFKDIEDVWGSDFNDIIVGNAGVNLLDGAGGNDSLSGGGGNDTLSGGDGNDTLDGGTGADSLEGGLGNDTYYVDNAGDKVVESVAAAATGGTDLVVSSITYTLGANVENLRLNSSAAINGTGNDSNNVIYAGAGANVVDGAKGTDTLSFAYATGTGTAGVTLNLAALNTSGYATASGISGADKVKNIENVAGSTYNDVLTGNAGANVLSGGAGNDMLNGGAGKDTLDGGAGKDIFVFNTALSATANVDTIKGFVAADDTIRLENAIFKKLAATGTLKASFFVANASGKAAGTDDYIVYETDTGKLFYDADGSGAGAAIHFATLTGNPSITAADFVVI